MIKTCKLFLVKKNPSSLIKKHFRVSAEAKHKVNL